MSFLNIVHGHTRYLRVVRRGNPVVGEGSVHVLVYSVVLLIQNGVCS